MQSVRQHRPASAPVSQPPQFEQPSLSSPPHLVHASEVLLQPRALQHRSKSVGSADLWMTGSGDDISSELKTLEHNNSVPLGQHAVAAWAFSAPIDAGRGFEEDGWHSTRSGGGVGVSGGRDIFAAHLSAMRHIHTSISTGKLSSNGSESAHENETIHKASLTSCS